MSQFVTDTHPIHWHLTADSRLSPPARQIFAETDEGFHRIWIPGIVLIKMVYLTEKNLLPRHHLDRLLSALDTLNGSYQVASLEQEVTRTMLNRVTWAAIPELADRIISATAVSLDLPLITKDERIHRSGLVKMIW